MVIETLMSPSEMPPKRIFMSRMLSMATPAMPTSRGDAGMVRVVAPVGRQVEGDRQALLPGGEVAAVEGVRLLGGREAGVLPDGPGAHDVHRGVRPPDERRQARHRVQMTDALQVARRVEGSDRDLLGGRPGQLVDRPARFGLGRGSPAVEAAGRPGAAAPGDVAEIRDDAHDRAPSSRSRSRSVPRTSHRMKMKRSIPAAR